MRLGTAVRLSAGRTVCLDAHIRRARVYESETHGPAWRETAPARAPTTGDRTSRTRPSRFRTMWRRAHHARAEPLAFDGTRDASRRPHVVDCDPRPHHAS